MNPASLTLTVAARTHVGNRRARNEDAFLLGDLVVADALDATRVASAPVLKPFLVAVADGMGGAPAGEVASRLVLEHLRDAAPADEEALVAALEGANARIFAAMDECPVWRGMGTTVAGILICEGGVLAFGVGDCFVGKAASRAVRPLLRSMDDIAASSVVDAALGATAERKSLHIERHRAAGISGRYVIATDGIAAAADGAVRTALLDADRGPEQILAGICDGILAGPAPDNLTCIVMEAISA